MSVFAQRVDERLERIERILLAHFKDPDVVGDSVDKALQHAAELAEKLKKKREEEAEARRKALEGETPEEAALREFMES